MPSQESLASSAAFIAQILGDRFVRSFNPLMEERYRRMLVMAVGVRRQRFELVG
jgi:hypothetical protein